MSSNEQTQRQSGETRRAETGTGSVRSMSTRCPPESGQAPKLSRPYQHKETKGGRL